MLHITKINGIAVSKSKVSLFQTNVRFLGHYIAQGTITPIERYLAFASKFQDRILDKNQLQRFLGSLNYVLDFGPNINSYMIDLRKIMFHGQIFTHKHFKKIK